MIIVGKLRHLLRHARGGRECQAKRDETKICNVLGYKIGIKRDEGVGGF